MAANAARQFLAAGLVDEMEINLAPTLLGSGERLFEQVGDSLQGLALARERSTMTEADIRAMFTAVDASDWDGVDRFLHPELEYLRPGMEPLIGKAAMSRFYREVRTLRGEHRFDGIVVDRGHGACWGRFVGRNAAGPVDVQFADCYGFKDGLLWRRKSFFFVPAV